MMLLDTGDRLHDHPPDPAERSFLKLACVRDQMHLRIPSRVDWIELAVMYLAHKAENLGACDSDRTGKIITALTEAITNAIVHGNLEVPSSLKEEPDGAFARTLAARSADPTYCNRCVEIEMCYDGKRCEWKIRDEGPGFDVAQVLARLDSQEPEALLASGRGILLMRAFLDEVTWSEDGRRVHLLIEKPPSDAGHDRRAQPRGAYTKPIRLILPTGEAVAAAGRDLSRSGMAFVAQFPLSLGDVVELTLESWDGGLMRTRARVMRVHHMTGPFHDIGVKFLD